MYIEYMYFMVGTVKLVKSKTVKRKKIVVVIIGLVVMDDGCCWYFFLSLWQT